jgi:hypothetical protein
VNEMKTSKRIMMGGRKQRKEKKEEGLHHRD